MAQSSLRRGEDEVHEAHKISCCMKTISGKKQALPWITIALKSFHWKTRIIKLLHLTSLSSTDAGYQTLSMHSGRADNGIGLGMMVTSCQTFLSLKQCLSQCAGVCVFFPWHARLAHRPAGVCKGLCFLLILCCWLLKSKKFSQILWEE